MAKSLDDLKEQIRKADEKKKALLVKMKTEEAKAAAAQDVIFAKIGKLVAGNPALLTLAGRIELGEAFPDLIPAAEAGAENAAPEDRV